MKVAILNFGCQLVPVLKSMLTKQNYNKMSCWLEVAILKIVWQMPCEMKVGHFQVCMAKKKCKIPDVACCYQVYVAFCCLALFTVPGRTPPLPPCTTSPYSTEQHQATLQQVTVSNSRQHQARASNIKQKQETLSKQLAMLGNSLKIMPA